MTRTGIGQDGYFRLQKEVAFGTDIVTSMTDIPLKEGLTKGFSEMIENANFQGSRMKQEPDAGRTVCPLASLKMDYYPDLVGAIYQLFLGAASSSSEVDSTYTHTWLIPKTGERIGNSFTAQQAVGIDLVDQFAGCTISALVLEADTQGNMTMTFETRPQGYTEDVARISSFTFPTTTPFNWSFGAVSMTPLAGESKTDACINSMTMRIDLQYDLERYKVGDKKIKQPTYLSIPQVTLDLNVDAERLFLTDARILKEWDITLIFISTEYAGGTTAFQLDLELPGARLSPETEIPNENDALSMDLSFDCGYGGFTTGSPAADVIGELRIVDATAAYA